MHLDLCLSDNAVVVIQYCYVKCLNLFLIYANRVKNGYLLGLHRRYYVELLLIIINIIHSLDLPKRMRVAFWYIQATDLMCAFVIFINRNRPQNT